MGGKRLCESLVYFGYTPVFWSTSSIFRRGDTAQSSILRHRGEACSSAGLLRRYSGLSCAKRRFGGRLTYGDGRRQRETRNGCRVRTELGRPAGDPGRKAEPLPCRVVSADRQPAGARSGRANHRAVIAAVAKPVATYRPYGSGWCAGGAAD